MNTRAKKVVIFSVVTLTAIAIVLFFIASTPQRGRVNADKITAAIHAYCRDAEEQDKDLPPSIYLHALITKGYLKHEDVSAFDGLEVTVYLKAYDTDPQSALMSARLPDGGQIVALAAGSVQEFAK